MKVDTMFIIATQTEIEKLEARCNEIMCYDCLFNKLDSCHMRDKGSIVHDEDSVVYIIERK